jgi:broad specificity phosphatase PhoE
MTTRLFLVRHGQTESNREGLALGRADVPLNDLGRRQAGCVASALIAESLVAVYASPLTRAVETARPVAAAHGLESRPEPGLIEMDIGELDGLTFGEVRERYPQLLEAWTGEDGPNQAMPGGERLIDVQQRASLAIEAIAERHADRSVCIVTHNFVLLSIAAQFLGAGLPAFRRLRHSVGGITTLDAERGRWRVVRLNDTCHLDGLG